MRDGMLEIVECRDCKKPEYYGAMIWYNGHAYCRRCTHERWRKESNYKWEPSGTDYEFPKYTDGIDYSGGK